MPQYPYLPSPIDTDTCHSVSTTVTNEKDTRHFTYPPSPPCESSTSVSCHSYDSQSAHPMEPTACYYEYVPQSCCIEFTTDPMEALRHSKLLPINMYAYCMDSLLKHTHNSWIFVAKSVGTLSLDEVTEEYTLTPFYESYNDPAYNDDQFVIIKYIPNVGDAYREIEIHLQASVDNAGIVPIIDYGQVAQGACLVLPYYLDGDLRHCTQRIFSNESTRLFANQQQRDHTIALWISNLADTLAKCHAKGIYHRDIKPDNLLLNANGLPLFTDFGFADKAALHCQRFIGTDGYMAPEICANGERTSEHDPWRLVDTAKADVWSLAITILFMLSGRLPWRRASLSSDPVFLAFLAGKVNLCREFNLTPEAGLLLKQMLDVNPVQRPTAAQVAERARCLTSWISLQ
ncbi:kinase-like domain-containing protein [Syncephalis plumigaleata]|nr:kinase-like domain-containing protein [Syncephalis plumigaleata]